MKYVVTNSQMRTAEQRSDQSGLSYLQMMENAGTACAEYIDRLLPNECRIAVLCGKGNNGGDGYVIARLLHEAGRAVSVLQVLGEPKSDCAVQNLQKLRNVPVFNGEAAEELLQNSDCAVDCIYGTGFHGLLPKEAADIIASANKCKYRIAIDVPSGVNSYTGELDRNCFQPTRTLVLAAVKKGLLNAPCSDILGEVKLLDIGIADSCYENNHVAFLTDESLRRPFPEYGRNTHKKTLGYLLGIAGSLCFSGAAFMCARAALKSGIGIYFAAAPISAVKIMASDLHEAVYIPLPENDDGFADVTQEMLDRNLYRLKNVQGVVIGCGLGNSDNTRRLTEFVIKNAPCPVVIDADGINSIAGNIDILKERTGETILTPHPLEFSRMTGISVAEIQSDRIKYAAYFAQKYKVTLVLKGADTVIAAPDGKVCVNAHACRGLSKGGSGDVLSGIVGAFIAQGIEPFKAACAGVYCHWRAGDILSKRLPAESILPGDLIDALPEVYNC